VKVTAGSDEQPDNGTIYDAGFFAGQERLSAKSAETVIPVILKLFPKIRSALDVGCGVGAWLRALRDGQVVDILGMDGRWVPDKSLLIERDQFCAKDLMEPIQLNRKFDLVICLEVAEHLPQKMADQLVLSRSGWHGAR
jgi:2-polyprenyl-3-methyl-5-hydroxy-6-metoxy-1,4-benzoquinol methylase